MSGMSEDDYEAIGEIMGEALKGVDQRLDPLEEQVAALTQERQRLVLQVREARMDTEEEVRDLRNELNAMWAEFDILRQCLSPKNTIKATEAVSMLRSIR